MTDWLPPGSDAAVAAGCDCPVLDNGHGRGILVLDVQQGKKIEYWMTVGCPLHDAEPSLSLTADSSADFEVVNWSEG